MRHLPKVIRLVRNHKDADGFSLTVDGEEFPYFLLDADIEVAVKHDDMPAVRVTLIADRVEVVNDWTAVSDAEKSAL